MQRGSQTQQQQRPLPVPGPARNPWVDRHPESSSSSARSLRRHYTHPRHHTIAPVHTGPPPAAEWLRPGPSQRLHGPQLNQPPPAPSIGSSPADSACGGGGPASYPVSSGCAKCDSFCYHCLQIVYIAGILTGMSLVIAGSVLRGNPHRGDLRVLVYIGVLLAAVCALLLSVQHCVRNTVKQRKRALRPNRFPVVQSAAGATELQQLDQLRHPHDFTDVRIESHFQRPRREVRQSETDVLPIGVHRTYPVEYEPTGHYDVRDYLGEFSEVRRSGRSRSSHSSHGRRYYLQDETEAPYRPDEWERERQPYQPLLHRPR